MFYAGPERYQVYEGRSSQIRNDPEYYPYQQRPAILSSLSSSRDFNGYAQAEFASRMRVSDSIDQGDELLNRLEQTGRVPSKDKFRRMACNTFIMTGACPYSDRCVFMHDFRIKSEGVKVRTTRQTKADNTIKDTFYWPDMTRRDIGRYLDAQGLPDANQRYVIPSSFASTHSSFHNRGLYSVWNHFVEFCAHNSRLDQENKPTESDPYFQVSDYTGNRHVFGTYRLAVFVQLSIALEEHNMHERRRLEGSFASGLTTRSGGTTPTNNLNTMFNTACNTTLNTSLNTTLNTTLNSAPVTPARATIAVATPKVAASKSQGLMIVPPETPAATVASAVPPRTQSFQSLVIQAQDDEEVAATPPNSGYRGRERAYSHNTARTNYSDYSTYSTPTTPRYDAHTSSAGGSGFRATPATQYPSYPTYATPNNSANYQYSVYSPHNSRAQPSFADMRAASAASVANITPYNSNSNTTPTNRYGNDHPSQRHYYPSRASFNSTADLNESYASSMYTSRPTTPRNADYNNYSRDAYGGGEGYTHRVSTATSACVSTSYTITPPDMEPETGKSHMYHTSAPAHIPIQQAPAHTNQANNKPLPVATTATNTARSATKNVNWADLNDSSSTSSSDVMQRVEKVPSSDEWEQMDKQSTSSISDSNDGDLYQHNSVYDVLQQTTTTTYPAATTSNYYTNHPASYATNTTAYSPWVDPMALDLNLLGGGEDGGGMYSMRDTGNIRELLSAMDSDTPHTATHIAHTRHTNSTTTRNTNSTNNYHTSPPMDIHNTSFHSELFDEGTRGMGTSVNDDAPYTLSLPWMSGGDAGAGAAAAAATSAGYQQTLPPYRASYASLMGDLGLSLSPIGHGHEMGVNCDCDSVSL